MASRGVVVGLLFMAIFSVAVESRLVSEAPAPSPSSFAEEILVSEDNLPGLDELETPLKKRSMGEINFKPHLEKSKNLFAKHVPKEQSKKGLEEVKKALKKTAGKMKAADVEAVEAPSPSPASTFAEEIWVSEDNLPGVEKRALGEIDFKSQLEKTKNLFAKHVPKEQSKKGLEQVKKALKKNAGKIKAADVEAVAPVSEAPSPSPSSFAEEIWVSEDNLPGVEKRALAEEAEFNTQLEKTKNVIASQAAQDKTKVVLPSLAALPKHVVPKPEATLKNMAGVIRVSDVEAVTPVAQAPSPSPSSFAEEILASEENLPGLEEVDVKKRNVIHAANVEPVTQAPSPSPFAEEILVSEDNLPGVNQL